MARLGYEKAEEIREKYFNTNTSTIKLGKEYGISQQSVWRIINYDVYNDPTKYNISNYGRK